MAQGSVRGRVLDRANGLPVAGAEIRAVAVGEQGTGPLSVGRAKEDGAFDLAIEWAGAANAAAHVDARAAGYATESWRSWHDNPPSPLSPGGVLTKDLRLGPGFTLVLEVSDDRGNPVEGATIDIVENNFLADCCAWPLRSHPGVPADQLLPRSDAAGRAELGGLRDPEYGWRYFVSITHPERAEGMLDRPEGLPRERGVARARVVLSEGLTIDGVLRGGRPAEGSLTASLEDPRVPGCHRVLRHATIDPHGHFRITGLRPGTHTLQATAPGAASITVQIAAPHEGSLTVELPSGRELRCRVLGEGGEPVAGARVTAEWPEGQRQAETDAEGNLALILPVDRRVAIAALRDAPVFAEGLGLAFLEPGDSNEDIVFDARQRGGRVGEIEDDRTGEPPARDVVVIARPRGTTFLFRGEGNTGDGRFELHVPPGEYSLAFEAIGSVDLTHSKYVDSTTIAAGVVESNLRVPVGAAFVVKLQVIDAVSAHPVSGAAVQARPPGIWSRLYLGHTDETGNFVIDPAVESPMHIEVAAPGFERCALQRIEVKRGMASLVIALRSAR